MARTLLIAFTLILAAGEVVAATNDEAATKIRAVMDRQVAAWNRGDIDGYMEGYVRSDKLEFVSAGKVTRGWQTVRDRYHRKYDSRGKMGALAFSDIKVTSLNANTAFVQGRWSLKRKSDHPHGSFALRFRRTPSGWRIVHDETS